MVQSVEPVRAYKLDALMAEGFSARTIRYYIQTGVLPKARCRGPNAWYDETHLAILRKIAKLRDEKRGLSDLREDVRRTYRRAFEQAEARP